MTQPLSARVAVCRLLEALWDPHELPAPASIPWPEVLRLVGPSNVASVVHAVTREMRTTLPDAARETLEQAYYRTVAANTLCLHQLTQLREGLSTLGTPLLLLKGAALAQALYPEPALRLIGDIDVAVPLEGVPACREALLAMGYTPGQVEEHPGSLLAHSNQELFLPPAPYRTTVEVHWHILDVPYYLRRVPMGWFWEHTESLEIAGGAFRVLDAEANLLYLPAHLALHHRFWGWHSLLDLALLVVQNQGRLDWERIGAAAQSFELLEVLRATLDRLEACWPALPLGEARRSLKGLVPSRMDARLFRLLTAESRSNVLDWYTTLVSLPGVGDRARFVWTYLLPDSAYMRHRYGVKAGWHLPYWYLVRLIGGLVRMLRALPRARRLDRETS